MWSGGDVSFQILEIVSGNDAFNYYFTLVWVFGMVACMFGLLVKVLTRS
jgi:hypothetical protein